MRHPDPAEIPQQIREKHLDELLNSVPVAEKLCVVMMGSGIEWKIVQRQCTERVLTFCEYLGNNAMLIICRILIFQHCRVTKVGRKGKARFIFKGPLLMPTRFFHRPISREIILA